LEAFFERIERGPGFVESLCILKQSHEAQAQAGGREAVTRLVGELVVNCEHGLVSIRDASDVPSTLLTQE
jgi:hypothetical protein